MADPQGALAAALAVVDCRYAQILVEDPRARVYRVRAAHLPAGNPGYDCAHRLGVIGQVFRSGQAILVADTREHALYDAYDDEVDWELATPVQRDGRLVAVLNLEGRRPVPDFAALWPALQDALRAALGAELPAQAPRADQAHLATTVWVDVAGEADAALALALLTAAAGCWTLVLTPGAALDDAQASHADLEAALGGLAERLDAATLPASARVPATWRARLTGRYDYVVTCSPRSVITVEPRARN